MNNQEEIHFKTEQRSLNELLPASYNPRRMTKKQNDDLKQSLSKFNLAEIPVINTDNTILAGHQRVRVLGDLYGLDYVIDVRVPNRLLTEEEEKEYNIRSNKNTGEWDFDKLANEYDTESLKSWGFEDFEFGQDTKNTPTDVEECDFDESTVKNVLTKNGDLYEIGTHKLLCGDSTIQESYTKLMQNEFADMVVTDPPYNVSFTGKTKDELTIENDSMSNQDFYDFLYKFYSSLKTVTRKGGAIYVWHAPSEIVNFAKSMVDAGWLLKQQLIWVKNTLVMGRQDYQWKHEPCLYGWLDGGSHNWYSDRKQTTVINFDKPSRNAEHPTMKPVGLFAYQIQNSSKEQDTVIDPFGGSGTTMLACHQLNRNARLIEFDPKYCDVIVLRMLQHDKNLTVKCNSIDVTSTWLALLNV